MILSKFQYNTQAEEARKWLAEIDLTSANIGSIEQDISKALALSRYHQPWYPIPIAPLAEPVNLQELLGDQLNGAQGEIIYQAGRVDNLYRWASDTNNSLTAQLEAVEKSVVQASSDIQDIVAVVSQDPQFYYWVSDTFNSTSFVDLAATTALVDTDHGLVMLSPKSMELVRDLNVEVLPEETRGLPGSNLLIIDKGNAGGTEKEPEPVFESAVNTDFANLFDNDPSTWFEVERNFIPPRQKLARAGRAYIYSSSGEEQDVVSVTGDLDWKAYVQWWNKPNSDTGADGKGVPLAEFRSVQDPVLVGGQSTTVNPDSDLRARLSLRLNIDNPRALSYLNVVPFQRAGQSLTIDSIKAFSQGQEIELARSVTATPTLTNTSLLNREILRRTGSQSTGGMFSIPTDRSIEKIEIRLSSPPVQTPYGLGHPFAEKLEHIRREQRVVFFSIVNHEDVWTRIPYNETPRQIKATFNEGGLLGSLPAALSDILGAGQSLQAQLSQLFGRADAARTGVGGLLESLGQTGAAASWLGKTGALGTLGSQLLGGLAGALPIVGGLLAAGDVFKPLFGSSKEVTVKEIRKGTDIFQGWRASVGLRSLSILRLQFVESCQIQSVKLNFQGPVSKIGLFAEEDVPVSWGPGDWISYYLSVDGENWMQVNKLTDVTLDGGFVPDQPTESVYFRAILRGNPEDNWTTPELRHYSLQGLPA